MLRAFFAGTSIKPRNWKYLNDPKPLYENHKNVVYTKDGDSFSYYFPGPLAKFSLDQGTYTIEKNYKRGVEVLSNNIKNLLKEKPGEEIQVEIAGHSRGGVTATRVAEKIKSEFKDNKNVKINLITLDPVPGPMHFKDNVRIKLAEGETNKSVVVYSMDTKKFFYTPQEVKNSDVVIILPGDHESVYGKRNSSAKGDTNDVYHYYYNGKSCSLSQLLNLEKGVYIADDNYNLTKVSVGNLKECMNKIYSKCKDSTRQRVLIDSIIERSGFGLDDILEANPKYKKQFENKLKSIKKSRLLKNSFKAALDMFRGNSIFKVLLNKEGAYEPIFRARYEIFLAKSSNPQKAYSILKNAKQGKGVYVSKLLDAVADKVSDRYALDKAWYLRKNNLL